MYVNEFARRLGLPASKVRYYDRSGLYQSRREPNNYRDFTDADALDVYLAQSLRSIDLNMEQALLAVRSYDSDQLYDWLSVRMESLKAEIAQAQAKLDRLEQLRRYSLNFSRTSEERAVYCQGLKEMASFSIRTFGSYTRVNEEVLSLAAALGNCMPYSYIALTIPEESLGRGDEILPVGVGLGILKKHMARCGLAPSPVMDCFPGEDHLLLFLEREDVFRLRGSDLEPLFAEARVRNLRPYGDVTGRVAFAREKNGRRCYGVSLRCQAAPL